MPKGKDKQDDVVTDEQLDAAFLEAVGGDDEEEDDESTASTTDDDDDDNGDESESDEKSKDDTGGTEGGTGEDGSADGEDDEEAGDDGDKDTEAHKDRSALGRKVARLEKTLEATLKQLELVTGIISGNVEPEPEEEFDFGDDDDEPLTKAQVMKMLKDRDTKKVAKQEKYTNDYKNTIIGLRGDEEPEVFDAVVKVMHEKFNVYRTGNGKMDAQTNYIKAKNFLITGQMKEDELESASDKINPLKKDKQKTGLGGPLRQKINSGKRKPKFKLDKHAADFARASGMSDEDIADALSNM